MPLPRIDRIKRTTTGLLLAAAALLLTACDGVPRMAGGSGQSVQVALLVPAGAPDPQVQSIARSLTNAAQLAVADLDGVQVDLRIYDTQGSASQAAALATRAVSEGADVIVGPLYAQSANAAGLAVAGQGVPVLAFSNNTAVAGGNVFVLGSTFDNTARRLVSYAGGRGLDRVMVVSGDSAAEQAGRDAVVRAAQSVGSSVVNTTSFPLSQEGIVAAAPSIAAAAEASGANALFMTSSTDAALPFLVSTLPDAGLGPTAIQYVGLTRWDVPASAVSLPGLQGGWYALPDPGATQAFGNRYAKAYGSPPHPIGGLGYDGIAAVGALAAAGRDITPSTLSTGRGFAGATGAFRLFSNGTNQRALAIATIENSQVRIVDAAPRGFGGAGF